MSAGTDFEVDWLSGESSSRAFPSSQSCHGRFLLPAIEAAIEPHVERIQAAAAPRAGPTGRTESPEAARNRGAVDVALASVMRDAMLRRSEAAALEWADVELRPDGSGRLRVRRSKTDQQGEGAVQYLGKGTAAAVREIRPGNPDPDARVFGLRSGRSVARRLAAMARAAGLEGAFSGHSARVGMARDLVASGASVAAVQIAGRWKSPRMPAHYARGELAARGAVARFHGEA